MVTEDSKLGMYSKKSLSDYN